MQREHLINFIKRKDSFYSGASFAGHSDQQLRDIALRIDSKVQTDKKVKWRKINKPERYSLTTLKPMINLTAEKNLDSYSITGLTIIKTEIEIRIANSKGTEKQK